MSIIPHNAPDAPTEWDSLFDGDLRTLLGPAAGQVSIERLLDFGDWCDMIDEQAADYDDLQDVYRLP